MKKIVAKFGGSSVKDGSAMHSCFDIISKDKDIKVVILSATYNTTNELEKIYQDCSVDLCSDLINRHLLIAESLGVLKSSFERINKVKEEIFKILEILKSGEKSLALLDVLYSCGERLSTSIFYEYLKLKFGNSKKVNLLDAADIIRTDINHTKANPLVSAIKKTTCKYITDNEALYIMGGFFGSSENGVITTLGREGSDFSAALIAEAIGADLLQIWTDVTGIKTADPKIVPCAKRIDSISYDEATILCSKGAKVLFSRTMEPCKRADIEIFIGSTKEVGPGTLISSKAISSEGPKAMSFQKDGDEVFLSIVGGNFPMLDYDMVNREEGLITYKLSEKEFQKSILSIHESIFE